ncbi:hypothetical protein, partial [Candidatus Venteria ishoeyi]|uniref:hypothetical protein n=1 Tax=Candidatus Venteria ishoeyi TaxID=1899563 RepID=UPI0011B089E1
MMKRKRAARIGALTRRAAKYGMLAQQFKDRELAQREDYFNPQPSENDLIKCQAVVDSQVEGAQHWSDIYVARIMALPQDRSSTGIDFWYHGAALRDWCRKHCDPMRFMTYQARRNRLPDDPVYEAEHWQSVRLELRGEMALKKPAVDFDAFLRRWVYASRLPKSVRMIDYLATAEFIESYPGRRMSMK